MIKNKASVPSRTKRSASSRRWLARQRRDRFTNSTARDGYRARSAYKLLEIDDKLRLLRRYTSIIDLGAAPGSWSQVVQQRAPNASVVACDILPMEPIEGIKLVQGDFAEQKTRENILAELGVGAGHLVLSDLAPNMTGLQSADQASMLFFAEQILEFVYASRASALLMKLFMGEGIEQFVATCKQHFSVIKHLRPEACRKESREFYLYANAS